MGMPSPDDARARPARDAAERDALLPVIDWARLPPGVERDTVPVPSGLLARVTAGPPDGERVLLVPGMTGSKEDFLLMMPLFAAEGYRVESYDLAGQYESAAAGPENLDPPRSRYTLDLFVDDLLAVVATGSTPVHALGYSFAGTVVSVAAVRHPELFSDLTLLSAPPLGGQALRGFKAIGPVSWALPGRALGRPFIAAVRSNVHRTSAERAAFIRKRFEATRPSSVGDILALMKRTPEVADALRATGLPVLVAAGTGDVWPLARHRAFAERAGGRLLILPTGHSPCETTPHQLTEAMLAQMRG